MTPPSVRLPPVLPAVTTGDPAVDAAVATIHAELAATEPPTTGPVRGKGALLGPCLIPELLDMGEVVWDDDAVDALPMAARSKLKKEADLQYRQAQCRKQWLAALLRELQGSPEGRGWLRKALAWAPSAQRGALLKALSHDASREDYEAIAAAVPHDIGHPQGAVGARARLALDPRWGERFFGATDASVETLACVLIAVDGLAPEGQALDPRWRDVAVAVLGDDAFAQFGQAVLERFPADEGLLALLLRGEPTTTAHVELLARHDSPRVLPLLGAWASEHELGDDTVREALEASSHALAAETAFAVVAALEAGGAPGSRVKRYKALAKALGARFGVKPTKAPKPSAPPPPKAPEAAPAPARPALPPVATLEAELRAAFEAARISAHFDVLVSPAAALLSERVELSSLPLGVSRLGGLPDLPPDQAWPVIKRSPATFVGQIALAEIAPFRSGQWAALLPQDGLLSFFVHDRPGDDYGRKGTVLFTPAGVALVRHEPPPAMLAAKRTPGPSCRLEFVPTLRLAHPSHRLVEALPFDDKAAYEALRGSFDAPLVSTLLGFRDRYDGELKRGYRLLLQVTSDAQADFHWGDEDELCFFVAERALLAGDFSVADVRIGD